MTQQLSIGDLVTNDAVRIAHSHAKQRADRRSKDKPEDIFDFQLRQHRMPAYARQAMFAKAELNRRWMFDFCWQKYMVAVEIEGLVTRMLLDPKDGKRVLVVYGRHATIDGFIADCEKYAWANSLGWHVLRFAQAQVKTGFALEMTMRTLVAKGWAK